MAEFVDAVAIDGPAGSGKSSLAKRVADARGFLYIDTGAMYRAVTLRAIRLGADLEDAAAVTAMAREADICFDASGTKVILDGADASRDIRDPGVTAKVKCAARVPEVRNLLVEKQRAMAERRPVVMEGRDITTVVLPRARWKFYLTASAEARARRRYAELLEAGRKAEYDNVLAEVNLRDASDYEVGPLKDARDRALSGNGIHYLDTSGMTLEEAAAAVLAKME